MGMEYGEGLAASAFWVCVLFNDLCRVKIVCFVVRILDVHRLNASVFLLL